MKSAIFAGLLMLVTTAAILAQPALNAQRLVPFVDPSDGTELPSAHLDSPAIDVVFVLDTTGSMSGLIDTAKQKIWSIASSMASAQNAPEIRVGLVAYRDRGDAYVTRVTDLSHDLDSVYGQLMEFQAAGGGDTPESGHTALRVAVDELSWSEDQNVYKTVFLVGDAPAHTDYQDEQSLSQIVQRAVDRGILVNTIRCGNSPATEAQWLQIANLSQGKYLSVGQNVAAVAIDSPFDPELAETSAALDATRMPYGDDYAMATAIAKADATAKLHSEASEATRARRAAFNAKAGGAKNLYGDNDLVEAVVSGRVDLETIAPAELPAPLQGMTLAEQRAHIAGLDAERKKLAEHIDALSELRAAYLHEKAASMSEVEESFEYQIYETVKSQAAEAGIEYADAAPEL
ncbi:MAG: vWA domain-containing protein [Pseudomonadota bacterium]